MDLIKSKINRDTNVVCYYVLSFLNKCREKYNMLEDDWYALVRKHKIATLIVEKFDCVRELEPDTFAFWFKEYLDSQGEEVTLHDC